MAHHKSAEKRLRQTVKRTAINRARDSRVKTAVKSVEAAIASGKKDTAEAALKAAQPILQSGVGKGVLHKNTAARKISRLSKRVKALYTLRTSDCNPVAQGIAGGRFCLSEIWAPPPIVVGRRMLVICSSMTNCGLAATLQIVTLGAQTFMIRTYCKPKSASVELSPSAGQGATRYQSGSEFQL
jgi:small subunit ribosomal protein S20